MSKIFKNLFKAEKWDAFARVLLLIYITECTFGSSGRWLEIGPLSIRMILFGLCFIATLPAVIRNVKELVKNWQVIITVCFGIYILICAAVGFFTGNNTGFILADITTLMALALVPGFLSVMCNKKAIENAMNAVFYTATILGGATMLLHFSLAFIETPVVMEINSWINEASLGGMAVMQTGMQRLYMKSQIFLQVAIVYGVWKIGKSRERNQKILLCVCEGILLCACILSFTRGFWLGLAASAIMFLFTGRKYWKRYLKIAAAMMLSLLVFLAVSWGVYQSPAAAVEIVNRFDPDLIVIDNTNGDMPDFPELEDGNEVDKSNLAAVTLRAKTLALSKQKIAEKPLFGNGLGENLDEIRKDGRTEYMYIDMTMKTGVIGTTLFVLTFFGFVVFQTLTGLKRKKLGIKSSWEDAELRNRFITAAYLGVAVTSFFNPFLNNPMGIMLLMLSSAAVYEGEQKNSEV